MGLAIALLLGLGLLVALWRLARFDRPALQFAGAAVFLALAGYAVQGSPGLRGQGPVAPTGDTAGESEFARTREALLGRFDRASQWLIISESLARRGKTEDAVGIIRSGIRANPKDSDLWTGLGTALVNHAGGALTPAAELAFARAAALAPGHPGPRFYYGLALAQNGRFAEAEEIWAQIVDEAPAEAEYREVVAVRLDLLRQIRAAVEEARQPPASASVPAAP